MSTLSHIEHLVIKGFPGKALDFLESVDLYLHEKDRNIKISTKYDGSVSVCAGINPENGRYFVSTKSVFNEAPKIFYSIKDIEDNTVGDLQDTLKKLFIEAEKFNIKSGIIQGDVMFIDSGVENRTIGGEDYITFHPNTLVYGVKTDTELADKLKKSSIGVIWHTKYTGESFSRLKTVETDDVLENLSSPDLSWMTTADAGGSSTMDNATREYFSEKLKTAKDLLDQIDSNVFRILTSSKLNELLHIYDNSKIRACETINNPFEYHDGFLQFIEHKYYSEASKRKTLKGKSNAFSAMRELIDLASSDPRITMAFELMIRVSEMKSFLLPYLASKPLFETFILSNGGYTSVAPEGFVISSGGHSVKLVNRLEFSFANFSDSVVKGHR